MEEPELSSIRTIGRVMPLLPDASLLAFRDERAAVVVTFCGEDAGVFSAVLIPLPPPALTSDVDTGVAVLLAMVMAGMPVLGWVACFRYGRTPGRFSICPVSLVARTSVVGDGDTAVEQR